MKVIYRAFDGTEFNSDIECLNHEKEVMEGKLVMMTSIGEVTTKPPQAAFVWIKDSEANKMFHSLAQEYDDEAAASTIDNSGGGFFYWSEWREEYVWLSSGTLENLIRFKRLVDSIRKKENV